MKTRITALVAAVALTLAASSALAASTVWLRIVGVKTNNVSLYMQELDKGRAILKRLGVKTQIRVWRATYAGPETGALFVSQEYASWTAFADAQTKIAGDKEFQDWLTNLDKVRSITSDSLYREL
jgi:hypothetical protein